jgi:hypothetical protein
MMSIVERVRTQVEDHTDYVSDFFIKVAETLTDEKKWIEVQDFTNSDTRLSLLKVDDKTIATVIETRTEFNHCEYIFSKL